MEIRYLALDSDKIREQYDVVVIGSGYGGSIAASRMARAAHKDGKKLSICLLEKGREFRPGDFPDNLPQATVEMQANLPNGQHIGRENGLYVFDVGDGISVFHGCGLGGTSLVNANVSLEADPRVFDDPVWPEEITAESMAEGYKHARLMLSPTEYPDAAPKLHKLETLEKSAAATGGKFYRTPINVTFVEGKNSIGFPQHECSGCGDCVTGCNYAAKNTLAMNYIPDAVSHGAEVFTQMEVINIQRVDDEWVVHYKSLGHKRGVFPNAAPLMVRAKTVFLAAGALGSTEILLKSKAAGLSTSDLVGDRFTGNGDVLGFAYNCDEPINSVGWGAHEREKVGPCITGVIDMRGTANLGDGMVIEDGSIPVPLAHLMPGAFFAAARVAGQDTDTGIGDYLGEKGREAMSLLMGPYRGAVRNTQVYLVMSHDIGNGKLELRGGHALPNWPGIGDTPSFQHVYDKLKTATTELKGTWVKNPISVPELKDQVVTVHPLGGCVIGRDAASGVVNHKCQVFADREGKVVHEGLYVVDGAVVPRPLGVNPLLTISALAERCCAIYAEDHGLSIDYAMTPVDLPAPSNTVGLEFTETMRGHFKRGATSYEEGEKQGEPFEFTMTIWVDDIQKFTHDNAHQAEMFGSLIATSLSPKPLTTTNGVFNQFTFDQRHAQMQNMIYKAVLMAENGDTFYLDGYKKMSPNSILHSWSDTSTLYFTIYKGSDNTGEEVGKGILHIEPADFARQMLTMRGVNSGSLEKRAEALLDFGKFFAGNLFDLYGGVFSDSHGYDDRLPSRVKRPLRAPAPTIHPVITSDGVPIRLTRFYDGTNNKGPLMVAHGLGVSSQIFSTDTIDTNLVEFLYAHGYDIWLLDFRQSIALPASRSRSTGDDVATKDYPAAVDYIREATNAPNIQALVHCFGGTTFLMSMLAGLQGIRSVAVSQVGLYPITPALTKIKCGLHMPELLDMLGVEDLDAYSTEHESWLGKLYNAALHLQPVPFDERCSSDVCHRITFMYSLLYEHDKLNKLTHDNLHEMFGVANIDAFKHLAHLVRDGKLVDAKSNNVYMTHLERLAVPITFVHGEENLCFLPEGTARTVETLTQANGEGLYQRHVVPGYGHIDCIFGRDAATDIYPHFLSGLEPYSSPKQ